MLPWLEQGQMSQKGGRLNLADGAGSVIHSKYTSGPLATAKEKDDTAPQRAGRLADEWWFNMVGPCRSSIINGFH